MPQFCGRIKWSVAFLTAVLLCTHSCGIALCQEARVSSARLFVRLVSYENPAGILISGAKCDSGSSACDPSFALTVSLEGRHSMYVSSKCSLSNTNQVDFASANLSEFAGPIASTVGAKPTWAMVNVVVKECMFDEMDDTIGEFQLNLTSNLSGGGVLSTAAMLATSEEAARIVAMQPIRLTPESIKLRVSVWTQCSPDYYGLNCDWFCEPNATCCCNKDGKLLCDQSSSIECVTRGGKPTTASLPTTTGIAKTRNINDEEASRSSLIMLIAVVTSSIVSILVLAGTAILAVKMCKTSESNAIFIRQMQSGATPASGTSASASLDPLPLCRHSRQLQSQVTLQPSGFMNPASYNTLTSSVTATLLATVRPGVVAMTTPQPRPDSGVYDEPMELHDTAIISMSVSSAGVPPLPARPLLLSQQQQQQQQQQDVQRMPQSKSYSRRPLNANNEQ